MASSSKSILLCFFLCLMTLLPSESQPTKPKRFVLPVRKDGASGLHLTYLPKRTSPLQLPLVVDLNALSVWLTCDQAYLSPAYRSLICHSDACHRVGADSCFTCPYPTAPGCHANFCGVVITNPVTGNQIGSELSEDELSIRSNQGTHPGPLYTVSSFLFVCPFPGYNFGKGMPKAAVGVAGFGPSLLSLQGQLASRYRFPDKFAICLSPSTTKSGVIFLGEGPYSMVYGVDLGSATISSTTPLTQSIRGEYEVVLKSIAINNKAVPLNTAIIASGGTKISTRAPYSVLEHSIYRAVRRSFAAEMGLKQAKAVAPFGLCYDARKVVSAKVPAMDVLMEEMKTPWRLVGANTMVEAKKGVMCLAFVDGGSVDKIGAAVVVGAKQMEDNLVVFDVANSKVGFSSWLPSALYTCAGFNFTASALT